MKYLNLGLLMLAGCALAPVFRPDPNWALRQTVIYHVPHYYSIVCSGHGLVMGKKYPFPNEIDYLIQTAIEDQNKGCPKNIILRFER